VPGPLYTAILCQAVLVMAAVAICTSPPPCWKTVPIPRPRPRSPLIRPSRPNQAWSRWPSWRSAAYSQLVSSSRTRPDTPRTGWTGDAATRPLTLVPPARTTRPGRGITLAS